MRETDGLGLVEAKEEKKSITTHFWQQKNWFLYTGNFFERPCIGRGINIAVVSKAVTQSFWHERVRT
jgi:hypothetical protein